MLTPFPWTTSSAMRVHAFSPMEISYGVDKTGMPLRDYLQMMKDEGLGSIPGTAAEILDDRVRQELSPNKLPAARWVEIITTAHELHHDVWARRRTGGLGTPHPPVALYTETYRRVYGICSARIHPREYTALSSWRSQAGSQTRRAPPRARPRAHPSARRDQKLASLLGQAGIRDLARVLASRRK